MKKKEQLAINEKVKDFIAYFNELDECPTQWVRLRTCTAEVGETEHFIILRSYVSIIAVIDKETDTLYDFLRLVYGYTSTSAQHISKFEKDYGKDKWGCHNTFRYYSV